MQVTDNEYEDPAVAEPKVTGAPDAIWLVYGDLELDATHAECYKSGEVTWGEDPQFPADVRYVRADAATVQVSKARDQGAAALALLKRIRHHAKRHSLPRDWLTAADEVLGTWEPVKLTHPEIDA